MSSRLLALLTGIPLAACSVLGIRAGTEEPAYTVVAQVGTVEVRRYPPRLAAEVAVEGDEQSARSSGFRILADYIFGANRTRATIAMTAPVAQSTATTIAMTAPVDQQRDASGRWIVRFFMPASYTEATLPALTDSRVSIVAVPSQTIAVLRYSGTAPPATVADRDQELRAALAGSAWTPTGPTLAWFYDPPWTLPPLRRNEAAVEVTGG